MSILGEGLDDLLNHFDKDPAMGRRLTTAMLAAAAIGGPYVASETEPGREAVSKVSGLVQGSSGESGRKKNFSLPSTESSYHAHYQTEALRNPQQTFQAASNRVLIDSKPVSLVGGPIHDLRDVLRFDISPTWVSQRFARVTTVLAELQLDGLRVPLVTGPQPNDLAGTMTYYFDHAGALQRVNIHGFIGDPAELAQTMQSYYRMAPEPTLDAGVMAVRWNGVITGLVKLTRAPVMHQDQPYQKYTVFLELNQPNLPYGLSHAAQQIVHADRHTGRW